MFEHECFKLSKLSTFAKQANQMLVRLAHNDLRTASEKPLEAIEPLKWPSHRSTFPALNGGLASFRGAPQLRDKSGNSLGTSLLSAVPLLPALGSYFRRASARSRGSGTASLSPCEKYLLLSFSANSKGSR